MISAVVAFLKPHLLKIVGGLLLVAGFLTWLLMRDQRMIEKGKRKIREAQVEEVAKAKKKEKRLEQDLRRDGYSDLLDRL